MVFADAVPDLGSCGDLEALHGTCFPDRGLASPRQSARSHPAGTDPKPGMNRRLDPLVFSDQNLALAGTRILGSLKYADYVKT